MEKIVSLCKRRGFIFQSSEIYGGINGFWDYGPLGAELKRNVKELWWNSMTRLREDVVGLDAAIIMAPQIWRAPGGVGKFLDPMSTCKQCKKLLRSDQVRELFSESEWVLIVHEAWKTGLKATSLDDQAFLRLLPVLRKKAPGLAFTKSPQAVLDRIKLHAERAGFYSWPQLPESIAGPTNPLDFNPLTDEELFLRHLATENLDLGLAYLPCPICGGELTAPRPFNLMLQTWVGPIQSDENVAYLRPETAQAIFAQFKNVHETSRQKIPFGIAQVGKAFRNEVTPRNFTFRSREFEQAEIEVFIHPSTANEWYAFWRDQRYRWWQSIGLAGDNLTLREHGRDELAHYAKEGAGCCDVEYRFPFTAPGFGELEGVAHRSDYDLRQHAEHSGKRDKMKYFDQERAERYFPHVIEPSGGMDRGTLALLCEAYTPDPSRPSGVFMKFHPRMAPVKAGIFPLVNKDGMPEMAEALSRQLRRRWPVEFDPKQSIGKRYARMDEAGTPYCFTIDGDSHGGPSAQPCLFPGDLSPIG